MTSFVRRVDVTQNVRGCWSTREPRVDGIPRIRFWRRLLQCGPKLTDSKVLERPARWLLYSPLHYYVAVHHGPRIDFKERYIWKGIDVEWVARVRVKNAEDPCSFANRLEREKAA